MPQPPVIDATLATALVADATTAPSLHNAQPWRFRYVTRTATLELYADRRRSVPHVDPLERALHLGCGAALFTLRVAAAHAGLAAEVRLLPGPDAESGLSDAGRDEAPLARVTLTAPPDPLTTPDPLAALYPAIRRRHTSRQPFDDTPVPPDIREALREAAAQEGATLLFPSPWHVQHLLNVIRDAEWSDAEDEGRLADLDEWTHTGPDADSAADGIPEYAFGPRKRSGGAPVRDFAGRHHPAAEQDSVAFESQPQLALLGTPEDRAIDWLRAGQATQRVLLLATASGLATALTSQALEHEDLRWAVRDPQSAMGQVQLVLRLGYGPAGTSTPRRRVSEVLSIE
ncbi:Acg family FMN-binding oxidoreductase [Streptomyces apocyni]|uniref:Acg family FMN-binding oxidoreductase n=1 Tax=Streptomyces apocyni TaxID=2654677 RepID=UPI0012EAD759|nr:nitroreductase family protein [Streptomyces apocyni]